MIAFFEDTFTRYPFNSFGSIVDDDSVGYASRPRPARCTPVASEATVAHESPSVARQRGEPGALADIWLNEGWASYAEWLWTEEDGGRHRAGEVRGGHGHPGDDPFWEVVIADPGSVGTVRRPVYDRGAATLHALRLKVGDKAFFVGARRWIHRYNDSTATTEDFEAVYEEASGKDLGPFFDAWLREGSKPDVPYGIPRPASVTGSAREAAGRPGASFWDLGPLAPSTRRDNAGAMGELGVPATLEVTVGTHRLVRHAVPGGRVPGRRQGGQPRRADGRGPAGPSRFRGDRAGLPRRHGVRRGPDCAAAGGRRCRRRVPRGSHSRRR